MHHLEGHLLSPLLADPRPRSRSSRCWSPAATRQLIEVAGVGRYQLLGETLDDAAGEAFDKTAKLLGLAYPGGPALARWPRRARRARVKLPRPMLDSGDLDFSFCGLKTAVLTLVRREAAPQGLDPQRAADIAREFQEAIVDVLVAKALARARARPATGGWSSPAASAPIAQLRARLPPTRAQARARRCSSRDLEFCTDNGAMIALAGALRLPGCAADGYGFSVRPRWDLASLQRAGAAVERRVAVRTRSAPDRALLACEQLADVAAVAPEQQHRDRDHRPRDRARCRTRRTCRSASARRRPARPATRS